MTYTLIRRRTDQRFLASWGGWVFSDDIRDAVFYDDESQAHLICEMANVATFDCEVVYATISISNVRG